MTTIAEVELIRARWRRTLDRHALDTTSRHDFALGGLAARLKAPSLQVLALPHDPETEPVEINAAFWSWLEAHQTIEVDGRPIGFGEQTRPTAHASALIVEYGRGTPWIRYLAVHRSGALELGLGDHGAREYQNREDQASVRVFSLISMVAYTWAFIKFGATLCERSPIPGPWQFTVALARTDGALLGNLGEGWAEPTSFDNTIGGCLEPDLLWHLELAKWPNAEDQERLAFNIGDRIEDAWGARQRRYLDYRGDRAGRIDIRRAY